MDDSPRAFPRSPHSGYDSDDGMSLRDYFAAQALTECIRVAAEQTPIEPPPMLSDLMTKAAAYAYFVADAMLVERSKPRA